MLIEILIIITSNVDVILHPYVCLLGISEKLRTGFDVIERRLSVRFAVNRTIRHKGDKTCLCSLLSNDITKQKFVTWVD